MSILAKKTRFNQFEGFWNNNTTPITNEKTRKFDFKSLGTLINMDQYSKAYRCYIQKM
jgi:hypothetical protein